MQPGQTIYAVYVGHALVVEDRSQTLVANGTTIQFLAVQHGHLRLTRGNEHDGVSCQSAVIPPRQRFGIRCESDHFVRLFVDAKSAVGKALMAQFGPRSRVDAEAVAEVGRRLITARIWSALAREDYAETAALMIAPLGIAKRSQNPHPAVAEALSELDRFDREIPTVAELFDCVGMGHGRLYSLFSAEVGMTLGIYARWQRIRRFCVALSRASDWREAAVRAGFRTADALAVAVNLMFGVEEEALETGWWIAP